MKIKCEIVFMVTFKQQILLCMKIYFSYMVLPVLFISQIGQGNSGSIAYVMKWESQLPISRNGQNCCLFHEMGNFTDWT